MKLVIKINDEKLNKIKYLLLNKEKKECVVVIGKELEAGEDKKLKELLASKIGDFKILLKKENIPLSQELKFIWPQLLDEIEKRFSHINGWLERAQIELKDKTIVISVESKIASKCLNDPAVLKFLKNRLVYYLNEEITVEVHNGGFLEKMEINNPSPTKNGLKKAKEKETAGNIAVSKQPSKKSVNSKEKNRPELIYGKIIRGKSTHQLKQIKDEIKKAIVEGMVFDVEEIKTRKGNTFYVIDITDSGHTLTVKVFNNRKNRIFVSPAEGDYLKIRGSIQRDNYSGELTMVAGDINKIYREQKEDKAVKKRVELHLHTKMSAMDALVDIEKVVERAAKWGHPALAITDHGVVQAFPDACEAGKKYGIKILYGVEGYLVDDGEPIVFNALEKELKEITFTAFDFETTGLNSYSDEIIEIGAVKIKGGKIIDEFGTFVKPQKSIPAEITKLTGINNQMVEKAPALSAVLEDFRRFIGETVLVAHNASFDYGFLRSAFRKTKMDEDMFTILDTLALSRLVFPELKNHRLNTLCKHLGIILDNHHRAVDDARACGKLLLHLLDIIKKKQELKELKDLNQLTLQADWKSLPTYHIILLARNKKGLKDLYRLVSNSHIEHFYRRPRILRSELKHLRDNLLLGSACEAGQLFRGIIANKDDYEIERLARFYDFLEIQPLGNNAFLINKELSSEEELKEINKRIYKLGKKLKKPVVATGDVHFIDPEDEIYRKVLQTGQGYEKAEEQAPLYFRTTGEMLKEFDYLGEDRAREVVIENTVKIANLIDELQPIPDGLYTPKIEGAEEQIREMTYEKAHKMYGEKLPEIIISRLEKELNAIINNGFAVIYLISHKLVKRSLDDGYLVGSRGSVGSSLVATMCEITEVNPLPPHYRCPGCDFVEFNKDNSVEVGIDLPDKVCPLCGKECIKEGFNIPFEVFMGFEGDKVPDIDLNFSGEYQGEIHNYTEELFGKDYVYRAGTISTIASKTAFGFVKGFMDENNLSLNKSGIKRLVKGCTGVRRTTGQHPGGLMVVPTSMDIHDFTPIQFPANDRDSGVRTTHFDYHSISGRILKLDLLGHDDPTSIRMLQELTGVMPEEIPLDDPDTMAIFSGVETLGVKPEEIGTTVGTLGIPEFGTGFVRQMLIDTRPTTFSELVRISGLSHGTDVWLNNAQELIKKGQATLSKVISARDDIMNYLIEKGLEPVRAFHIMENVRKGRGLSEKDIKLMKENSVSEWYIDSCKKIKYMFPRAHAAAYVMMAFRIAFFKVHYPEAFYATYFTTKADDFDAELVCQDYQELIKYKRNLEEGSNDLTAKEKSILLILDIAIEAIARGIKFSSVDLYNSDINTFKITDKGLLPPLISLQGLGSSAAENIAVSREEADFLSVEDLVNRSRISKTVVEILQQHGALKGLPEKNQLSLFNRN